MRLALRLPITGFVRACLLILISAIFTVESAQSDFLTPARSGFRETFASISQRPHAAFLAKESPKDGRSDDKDKKESPKDGRSDDQPISVDGLNIGHLPKKPPKVELPRVRTGTRERLGILLLFLFVSIALVYLAYLAYLLLGGYYHATRADLSEVDPAKWTLKNYVIYKATHWFNRADYGSVKVVMSVSLLVFLCGTFIYWILLRKGIWHAAWLVLAWLVGNDGGMDEPTRIGALIGSLVSIFGLLIFGIMLTLLHHMFQNWIELMKSGANPVLESGHTIVCGHSDDIGILLQELCRQYEGDGGRPIVVLTEGMPKRDMDEILSRHRIQLFGSSIVVRSGFSQVVEDLDFVGAALANRIIILSDNDHGKEVKDALLIQARIALQSQGWPLNGRILAEGSLWRNTEILYALGSENLDVVMVERWIARLFVETSVMPGIGTVAHKVTDSFHSSLYIKDVPEHFFDRPFVEASMYYQDSIPLGVLYEEWNEEEDSYKWKCEFGPGIGCSRMMRPGQKLILLAVDHRAAEAHKKPQFKLGPPGASHMPPPETPRPGPETIIILGWGALIEVLLIEIDKSVQPGTKLVVVSPVAIDRREAHVRAAQRRWCYTLKNITQPILHVQGMIGARYVLDELPIPLEEANRIFILGDRSFGKDSIAADACTMEAVVQIRSKLSSLGDPDIAVVPEIRNPRSLKICEFAQISNLINTAGMRISFLAAMAREPLLLEVFRELFLFESNSKFSARPLSSYIPKDQDIDDLDFRQVQDIVSNTGDVVAGWTAPMKDTFRLIHTKKSAKYRKNIVDNLQSMYGIAADSFVINPLEKDKKRPWGKDDVLFVIGAGSRIEKEYATQNSDQGVLNNEELGIFSMQSQYEQLGKIAAPRQGSRARSSIVSVLSEGDAEEDHEFLEKVA